MVMVKPAMTSLDVSPRRAGSAVPLAAYHVSGEYAMVKAAAGPGRSTARPSRWSSSRSSSGRAPTSSSPTSPPRWPSRLWLIRRPRRTPIGSTAPAGHPRRRRSPVARSRRSAARPTRWSGAKAPTWSMSRAPATSTSSSPTARCCWATPTRWSPPRDRGPPPRTPSSAHRRRARLPGRGHLRTGPRLRQVRLVSSGTEAAMSAVRLARGVTGRDGGEVRRLLPRPLRRPARRGGSGVATLGLPGSAGVPAGAVADTAVCPTTSCPSSTTGGLRHRGAGGGQHEPGRALSRLPGRVRAACDSAGALFIFDEVISGFASAGGATAGRASPRICGALAR